MESVQPLSAQLKSLLLHRLMVEWGAINRDHFSHAMKPPMLLLSETEAWLGRWTGASRHLSLSASLVLRQPWSVVIEVLKHEMAHQYVEEVLHITDETAHGPAFQRVCQRVGIDALSAGLPEARTETEDRILRRVTKLLALAESPNTHEAELAMQTAQRLMLSYNIDLNKQHIPQNYRFRTVGPVKTRHEGWEQVLGGLLAEHFFVRCIWVPVYLPLEGKSATVLELCGSEANLEIAVYVHHFLSETGARIWKSWRAQRGSGDRRQFLSGLMVGFREKLMVQQVHNQSEGLILAQDMGLENFMDRRYPRMRSGRGGSTIMSEAFYEGKMEGKKLILHKAVKEEAGNQGRMISQQVRERE